jgi:hypothetical protein
MKLHPLFREYLEGGEMVEWGAKTIPEGGYYALPSRRHGDSVLIAGDAAGFVDVPSLKGIHYAMQSGIYAARAIFEALKKGDVSAASLAGVRPHGGRQLHRVATCGETPQHAARLQGRLRRGRHEGGADDAHRRKAIPGGRIEMERGCAGAARR